MIFLAKSPNTMVGLLESRKVQKRIKLPPHDKIVNFADYQSAQSLANKTSQMFNDAKKLTPSNVTSSKAYMKISDGIKSLDEAIKSKKPVHQLQGIITDQIRKNIEATFKVKLKEAYSIIILFFWLNY